jgi:hypothetical protein
MSQTVRPTGAIAWTPRTSVANEALVTVVLFAVAAAILVAMYGSALPLLFALLLFAPAALCLTLLPNRTSADMRVFGRSFAIGLLAAGIASYYAIVLLDPFQLSSDASSFFELSSQAGPARSLQDLQTITEGAGAIVLWSWFYNLAALFGFPREPYIGILINVFLVAIAAVVCARSARRLYGDDEYRIRRLILFFTISGDMWLLAGVHLRDSVIFLMIALLTHAWIVYLSDLKHSRIIVAVLATVIAMPVLQVMRKEFFYVPLMVAFIAIVCLNFSRGRGDDRFITLVSVVGGLLLLLVAAVVFGPQIETLLLAGRETYGGAAIADSRSGSLGTALIVQQPLPIRIALGVPYLYYFPIPFWVGFSDESAIQLFKSINALSFYPISAFSFAGAFLILRNRQLRSPAFLFLVLVPLVFSVSIALTSLETRHLAAFMSLFFLVGLMPDFRNPAERGVLRLSLFFTAASMVLVHAAWFTLRYA